MLTAPFLLRCAFFQSADRLGPTEFLANGVPAPGLNVSFTPGTPTQGGIVDFTFDPLPPGTVVDIYKTISYSGAGLPVPTPPFQGAIRILEFPPL